MALLCIHKKAGTAYLKSEQSLPFGFERHSRPVAIFLSLPEVEYDGNWDYTCMVPGSRGSWPSTGILLG